MKYLLVLTLFFFTNSSLFALEGHPSEEIIQINTNQNNNDLVLQTGERVLITVIGQGVAPSVTISPAQAYALAKRAAMVDGYRLIAERVKGVRVEGRDTVQNMMVKNTKIHTTVMAMIKNASVAETRFENGLCEVEIELYLDYNQFN